MSVCWGVLALGGQNVCCLAPRYSITTVQSRCEWMDGANFIAFFHLPECKWPHVKDKIQDL